MARIARPGPTTYVRLPVCTRCWRVVPPDRDQCPNDVRIEGEQHPIRSYVPEEHEAGTDELRVKATLASIEVAEACLEAAKAGLR